MTLQNANSNNARGGALYLGSGATLNRVNILNSTAGSGAAFFSRKRCNLINCKQWDFPE